MPVPKNHNTRDENKAIKAGEVPEGWADKPAKRSQKGEGMNATGPNECPNDARWTKKHGKSHYGYKNHVNVDRQHKLVRRYHVSDAALHDSQAVDHVTGADFRATRFRQADRRRAPEERGYSQ